MLSLGGGGGQAIVREENGVRYIPQMFFILLLILSACATGEVEHIKYSMDVSSWKFASQSGVPGQYYIIEFIPKADDMKNWKELMTLQNFLPSWGGPSPEDSLNDLKAIREKECPGLTKWTVIAKDEKSILYEWQARPCLGWPDQHEIGRIIYGKYNRFVLRYTVKMYEIPQELRDKWIKILSEAIIVVCPSEKPCTEGPWEPL